MRHVVWVVKTFLARTILFGMVRFGRSRMGIGMARPKRDGIAEAVQLLRETLEDNQLPAVSRDRIEAAYNALTTKAAGAMSADEFVAMRRLLGRTQEDLAQDLGRRVRQIARYEGGEVPIPALVAQALKDLVKSKT